MTLTLFCSWHAAWNVGSGGTSVFSEKVFIVSAYFNTPPQDGDGVFLFFLDH